MPTASAGEGSGDDSPEDEGPRRAPLKMHRDIPEGRAQQQERLDGISEGSSRPTAAGQVPTGCTR